jgi:hypothetical protein
VGVGGEVDGSSGAFLLGGEKEPMIPGGHEPHVQEMGGEPEKVVAVDPNSIARARPRVLVTSTQ